MASHRKPRARIIESAGPRAAVGVTTAALASVTLLSQGASADEKPTLSQVKKQVDRYYEQAEVATQKYNGAKERTKKQQKEVDRRLDEAAKLTQKLNDSRRTLGSLAAAQYRNGGMTSTATFMLSENPQQFFEQQHISGRLTEREQSTVKEFQKAQVAAAKKRKAAGEALSELTKSQEQLRKSKETIQTKLADARKLLSKLTAEQKARLAEQKRKAAAEAKRKAEAAAREAAAKKAAAEKAAKEKQQESGGSGSSSGGTSTGETAAEKAIAFAKGQLGDAYVFGATGPNSWDCSSLTQAAYKSAGISIPRTTYDQVNVGTRVAKADLQPGDLVFFYSDVHHVGIYVGNGQILHAANPDDGVLYDDIDIMPFYAAVRLS